MNLRIDLIDKPDKGKYDLVIIAVGHQVFKKLGGKNLEVGVKKWDDFGFKKHYSSK